MTSLHTTMPSAGEAGSPGHARRRLRRPTANTLTIISMTAPVAGQLMLIIIMLIERRWLFACLIVPGLAGCLASAMSVISFRNGRQAVEGDSGTARLSPDSATRSCERRNMPGAVPPLETLLGLSDTYRSSRTRIWQWVAGNWSASAPAPGRAAARVPAWHDLSVPIGHTGDHAVNLDILASGPHAMVAGTTGSGKSKVLESWCLALACRWPPSRINFIFLDFKGGSAFRILHRLPHTVGFVSDLDVRHAARALRAIAEELHRRERLVARIHGADIDDLDDPPPRLVVVIDEFQALKQRLPDYMNRLNSLASLGRSLGMHLIVCTQNPLGQVGMDMKANIGLNICLRVRDPLQSTELIAVPDAAALSPRVPGLAIAYDGEQRTLFRCSVPDSPSLLTEACIQAARAVDSDPAALFSPPLPDSVGVWKNLVHDDVPYDARGNGPHVILGLADTGVALERCLLTADCGNIAIVGGPSRGKTSILGSFAEQLRNGRRTTVRLTTQHGDDYTTGTLTPTDVIGQPDASIWLVDDADALLDPLSTNPLHRRFMDALASRSSSVVFTLRSARHLRYPDHCTVRVLFPTGDHAADMVMGIDSRTARAFDDESIRLPGRAVLARNGTCTTVQCCIPMSPLSEIPHQTAENP